MVEGAREVVMAFEEGTSGFDSLLTEEKANHKHEISRIRREYEQKPILEQADLKDKLSKVKNGINELENGKLRAEIDELEKKFGVGLKKND